MAPVTPDEPFQAYVVTRSGDLVEHDASKMNLADLPGGELLVRVLWSAVNYKDAMVTRPHNKVARTDVLVPGVDLVGEVVDSSDSQVPVGSVVQASGHGLGVSRHGAFAAYARIPSEWAIPVPAGLSPRDCMVVGTAGLTAALSVEELEGRGLEPGRGPVIVTGASGGVGSLAVTLLASKGYEVVASTGKTAERAWLSEIGATRVIGRDDLDVDRDRTLGPETWAGAVDCVGGETLARVLRTLRHGATVAASGLTGGADLKTTVYPFIVRAVALIGVDTVELPASKRREVWERLASSLGPVDLTPLVAREITLEQLPEAFDQILAGAVRGRILVRVGA